MELVSVRVGEAPSAPHRVRLVGDVVYDDRPGEVEQYWFEVPEQYAESLSLSGDPWITSLLPLAVTLRQPLRIQAPVDPVLFENIPKLMEMWSAWYRHRFPWIRPVAVVAPRKAIEAGSGPRENAAFFSGGVDSFYMVLQNPEIRRLLCVHGFDIPLRVPAEFERLRERLATAAGELGRELVDVATNLRETRARMTRWGHLAHGCGLAGVALAFGPRFRSVHIAATHSNGTMHPWGSHPETDPLLSTTHTRIVHDGAGVPRSEKTEFLSRSDVAMRSLHVCYRINSSENCGNCKKCYLAMLHLEILGALPRSATFRKPDLERVKRIYLKSRAYEHHYRDIQTRALAAGRTDIARAIGKCIRRSRRLKPLMTTLQWLSAKRGVWRIARRVRGLVLAGNPR